MSNLIKEGRRGAYGNASYSVPISNGKSSITSKSKLLGTAKYNLRKYKSPEYSSNNILILRRMEDLYKDVRNVYHQEFDEAVQQYNQNQKHADRRIEDYFEHVAKLDQDMAVEIIFQCGDKKFREKHANKKKRCTMCMLPVIHNGETSFKFQGGKRSNTLC